MIGPWKFLGQLPLGTWKCVALPNGRVLFLCKDHAPRIYVDGNLEIIQ